MVIFIYIRSSAYIFPPTINAIRAFCAKGYSVHLFHYTLKASYERLYLPKEVKIYNLGEVRSGLNGLLGLLRDAVIILFQLKRYKPQYLLTYDGMSVTVGYSVKKMTKIKWIYHQHDWWTPSSYVSKILAKIEITLGKRADVLVFPQKQRASFFLGSSFDSKTVLILPNAPLSSWPNLSRKPVRRDRFICIYQGGLSARFNIDILIKSLLYLPRNICLRLVVKELDLKVKSIKELVSRLGLRDRVEIFQNQSYDELSILTGSSHVGLANFAFGEDESINNYYLAGASNKLSEYMSCGLPIVAPRTSPNEEYIQSKKFGLLVNSNTARGVAESISELESNKKLYSQISKRNLIHFQESLSYDIQIDRLLKLIHSNRV